MDGFHHVEDDAAGDGQTQRPPEASITERKQLVWNNKAVMRSRTRGMADVTNGNVQEPRRDQRMRAPTTEGPCRVRRGCLHLPGSLVQAVT